MDLFHHYVSKIVYWPSLATHGYFSINVFTPIKTIIKLIAGLTNLKLTSFNGKTQFFGTTTVISKPRNFNNSKLIE